MVYEHEKNVYLSKDAKHKKIIEIVTNFENDLVAAFSKYQQQQLEISIRKNSGSVLEKTGRKSANTYQKNSPFRVRDSNQQTEENGGNTTSPLIIAQDSDEAAPMKSPAS